MWFRGEFVIDDVKSKIISTSFDSKVLTDEEREGD